MYRHFAENGILLKDKTHFLDDLEDVLNGTVNCHVINKCSTVKVYYITSPPQEVHTNQVMSALITLSTQIYLMANLLPTNNIPWIYVLNL